MRAVYTLCPDLQPHIEGHIDQAQLLDVQTNDLPEAQRRWAPMPELLRVARETVVADPRKADEVQLVVSTEVQRREDAARPRPILAS